MRNDKMFVAKWGAGNLSFSTRACATPENAWDRLGARLYREGINAGPWHMPGGVAGDATNSGVARANGLAYIVEVAK